MEAIEKLTVDIVNSIFTDTPVYDYDQIQDKLIELVNALQALDDTEGVWCINEGGHCMLDELIVGSFWHFTEWHGGQNSKSYEVLSVLGGLYNPGMTSGPEDETAEKDCYDLLAELAQSTTLANLAD